MKTFKDILKEALYKSDADEAMTHIAVEMHRNNIKEIELKTDSLTLEFKR